MGKSSSTPSTPDPYQTAAAQTQMNEQTAQFNASLNRYNQYGPAGSSVWGMSPTGQWANYQTITPTAQGALAYQQKNQLDSAAYANQALQNNAANLMQPVSTAGLPGIKSSVDTNFGNQINQAQKSAYDAQMSLYQPQQQQQQENLQAQLAAQGAVQGSEAYNNAINNQQRQFDFQNTQLANNAVQTGNALQNQLFGQSLNAGQFQNQANQQGLNQLFSLQNQPLQVYGALSGNPVNLPNYNNNGQATSPSADLSSDVWNSYQGNVASANAKNAANNQTTSTVAGLASMAAMAWMMY